MRNRNLGIGIILALILILVVHGICKSPKSKVVTTNGTTYVEYEETTNTNQKILIYSTRRDDEYLDFLTNLEPQYELISVSACMDTYARGESYVVTYKLKDEWSNNDNTDTTRYKYYLFKTRMKADFEQYYNTFNFEKYEIVDISSVLSTYSRRESYMITFREKVE